MKILLGGVPLGCDNIGDEAIIACVVELLRNIVPEAELTVCTRDREGTAAGLRVATAPLYGFGPDPDWHGFSAEVRGYDVYMWFGATGLSDYPETAVRLLRIAQNAGVRTIVWGVGMNSELNPAFYRASGRRRKLLEAFSRCTLRTADFVSFYERMLLRRTRRNIRRALDGCELVVLRDAPSVVEVKKCGFVRAVEGADTAILLRTAERLPLPELPDSVRIGFCISEQSVVSDLEAMLNFWNRLLERAEVHLTLIPMNPVTDKKLMLSLAGRAVGSDRIECLDSADPATVQACAAQCRVLVSSRLHLLILGANAGTPGIGIERGSKIANWLANFGQTSCGSVECCDYDGIDRQIDAVLHRPDAEVRADVLKIMAKMRRRLDSATAMLRKTLLARNTA